eukprot:scaffold2.g7011.t1
MGLALVFLAALAASAAADTPDIAFVRVPRLSQSLTMCNLELLHNDTRNCGSCGRICQTAVGLQPACYEGQCGLAANPLRVPWGASGAAAGITAAARVAAAAAARNASLARNPADAGPRASALAAAPDYATCVKGSVAKTAAAKAGKLGYETDPDNCGSCGYACKPLLGYKPVCQAGKCIVVLGGADACMPGWADCDGKLGCEKKVTSPEACGGCTVKCSGAKPECDIRNLAKPVCAARTCPSGKANCKGNCVALASDELNCGKCGNACAVPKGFKSAVCTNGVCGGLLDCGKGKTDCNGTCVSTAIDVKNCGGCGAASKKYVCPKDNGIYPYRCSAGKCVPDQTRCTERLTTCPSEGMTLCLDTKGTDVNNCGGCNVNCPYAPGLLFPKCVAGKCGTEAYCVQTQGAYYMPCGTGADKKCLDVSSDTKNCGKCDVKCKTGELCVKGAAAGRLLQQESPAPNPTNPFLAGTNATPPPASPLNLTAAASPSPPPAAPVAAATPPAAEAAACPCSTDGLSGGVNTSLPGCRQLQISQGSNAFTCYVEMPDACPPSASLARSAQFPGASTRACSVEEALASGLPQLSSLIVGGLPQLAAYANALKLANLSSVPGDQITIFAPSSQAFNAAVQQGDVTREQLGDPAFLSGLLANTIVPGRRAPSPLAALSQRGAQHPQHTAAAA